MASLERRAPLDGVVLFAAAVRIAQESGGNLAETLERLAETLRRKAAIEGRIDALTAQGRLQGWVMAALPLVVGAALFAIEPLAMRPLLTTWQGWVVCAAVVALEGLGLHVIRRIVDIDV
jgi:tight adherence protein B